MPSKSDPQRRQSGLYQTSAPNSTPLGSNCAQDRERYGTPSHTHTHAHARTHARTLTHTHTLINMEA